MNERHFSVANALRTIYGSETFTLFHNAVLAMFSSSRSVNVVSAAGVTCSVRYSKCDITV